MSVLNILTVIFSIVASIYIGRANVFLSFYKSRSNSSMIMVILLLIVQFVIFFNIELTLLQEFLLFLGIAIIYIVITISLIIKVSKTKREVEERGRTCLH